MNSSVITSLISTQLDMNYMRAGEMSLHSLLYPQQVTQSLAYKTNGWWVGETDEILASGLVTTPCQSTHFGGVLLGSAAHTSLISHVR